MEDYSLLRNKKIAILAGGWSAEREISLKTGAAVLEALKELKLNCYFVDIKSEEGVYTMPPDINLAFIALHGRWREDGSVQKILETKQVLYTGSDPKSCELAMDKVEAKKIWRDLKPQKIKEYIFMPLKGLHPKMAQVQALLYLIL